MALQKSDTPAKLQRTENESNQQATTILVPRRRIQFQVRGNELAYVGLAIIVLIFVMAIVGPALAPYDPYKLSFTEKLQPPSAAHWFGTDEAGRDLFSRVLYGTRISLRAAVIVVVIASSIGVTLGTIAGYYGGWVDDIIMRVADIFMAFPGLVLAMAVSAAAGASIEAAILAVSFVWWPVYTRLSHGQVLAVREEEYVHAARAIGASTGRIMLRHVLPNISSVLLVRMTMDIGYAILYTASLGFIGLGAQEPTPEWGRMVATGRRWILDHSYYSAFPGLAIFVTVLAFTWVGDALRDILDPRMRHGT
jgi:peptide/nickel transport system permease protein